MSMKSRYFYLNLRVWVGCLFLTIACKQGHDVNQPGSSSRFPAAPRVEVSSAPSPVENLGWKIIQPGVEWQSRQVDHSKIMLVRLDPLQVRIRVAYAPQAPKTLSEWMNTAHPLIAMNGGYFEADYRASALTIADGVVSGHSYQGFGGMLAVDSSGKVELVSLVHASKPLNKRVVQAIQSFPRLVWDGKALPIQKDQQRARRTALALDDMGHLLLIVSDQPIWTLSEFSQWLVACNLEIVRALNLDGGPSTGLAIRTPSSTIVVNSESVLPQVLMIEGR